ncbi:MAG TPA: HlyD family efflux transporter periplasmic adaptor subunit [Lachnospiraceae bacterium]|nr:HlyD family efflux transporter periplasmic adaptor subunit [Lachnospiraceae bacterium]
MAKKRKRPKKVTKYRKPININLGLIIFGVLFIYIIVIVVSYFQSVHITPYEVTTGSLAVNNTYTGVALREETVIPSDYSGYINYYAREGEKISNGSMVYTVDTTGKLSEMVNEDTGDGSSLTDDDLSELKTEISDFSTSFSPEDFSTAYDFKFDIEGTVLKLANYKVLSSIDTLADSNLSDSINFGYAPQSGVLVYSTDGYEDVTADTLTPEMMDPANYAKNQFHSNDLIAEGDSAYKLVTSENWSIIIEVDEERALELEQESYIDVRFLKNNYTSWASISILRQNDAIYAKLDFNNSMITFATDRMIEIELLANSEEGLKIPNSAIVERAFYLIPTEYLTQGGNTGADGFIRETYLEDGTVSTEFVEATIYNSTDTEYYVDESVFNIGDYIIMPDSGEKYPISKQATLIGVYNINKGYADFKQITILYQNEEYSIVKSNTEYGLSVYDHIVLNGDTVNENDFIYN